MIHFTGDCFKSESAARELTEKQMGCIKKSLENFSKYKYNSPELTLWKTKDFTELYVNWDAVETFKDKLGVKIANRTSICGSFRISIRSKCYDSTVLFHIDGKTLNELIHDLPDTLLDSIIEEYNDEKTFIMEEYKVLKEFEDALNPATKLILETNKRGKGRIYDESDLPF